MNKWRRAFRRRGRRKSEERKEVKERKRELEILLDLKKKKKKVSIDKKFLDVISVRRKIFCIARIFKWKIFRWNSVNFCYFEIITYVNMHELDLNIITCTFTSKLRKQCRFRHTSTFLKWPNIFQFQSFKIPIIDEFYQVRKTQSMDFEALILTNVWSRNLSWGCKISLNSW